MHARTMYRLLLLGLSRGRVIELLYNHMPCTHYLYTCCYIYMLLLLGLSQGRVINLLYITTCHARTMYRLLLLGLSQGRGAGTVAVARL